MPKRPDPFQHALSALDPDTPAAMGGEDADTLLRDAETWLKAQGIPYAVGDVIRLAGASCATPENSEVGVPGTLAKAWLDSRGTPYAVADLVALVDLMGVRIDAHGFEDPDVTEARAATAAALLRAARGPSGSH